MFQDTLLSSVAWRVTFALCGNPGYSVDADSLDFKEEQNLCGSANWTRFYAVTMWLKA